MHLVGSLYNEVVNHLCAELEPLLLDAACNAVEGILPRLHHIIGPLADAFAAILLKAALHQVREIALKGVVVKAATVKNDSIYIVGGKVGDDAQHVVLHLRIDWRKELGSVVHGVIQKVHGADKSAFGVDH